MKTATQIITEVHAHGKENADDRLRVIPELRIGQYIPQGDINIIRLGAIPVDAVPMPPKAQLAEGITRGSRHCIKADDMAHCEFYGFINPNPLEGPIIKFNAPTTITHPEHGDQLWPAGIVAITYQRRYAAELRRIQD